MRSMYGEESLSFLEGREKCIGKGKLIMSRTSELLAFQMKELLRKMPASCAAYAKAMQKKLTDKTIVAYLKVTLELFEDLKLHHQDLFEMEMHRWDSDILSWITTEMIEEYLQRYRESHVKDLSGKQVENSIAYQVSAMNSYFRYLSKRGILLQNPVLQVQRPKIEPKKKMEQLTPREVQAFLKIIEDGEGFTGRQLTEIQKYPERFFRDRLMCLLILRSGLKPIEIAALNQSDLLWDIHGIRVIRKGQKEIVYVSSSIEQLLKQYLNERTSNAEALFVSDRGRKKGERLLEKSIRNIIRKFAMGCGIEHPEHISAQTLRATYIGSLISKTNDLSLVQDVMGQKTILTTEKYDLRSREIRKQDIRNILEENK